MPASDPAILPDHVLSAILTLAKRESRQTRFAFRGHDFELQQIFSDLTRTGRFPILDAFVFADSGPDPYSPILNESVSRLQLSGLIGRENPDYEVLFLRPAAERFYDEVLADRLSGDEVEQLKAIATQFLNLVSVIENAA